MASVPSAMFLSIRPLNAHPSASIRQIRTNWVAKLMGEMQKEGWLDTKPKVYASIPYTEVKALVEQVERGDPNARTALDAIQFKVLDGAHRITALRCLIQDPSIESFIEETRIGVEVVPETKSIVQRTLDAAAENAKNTRECARKTFVDDFWAMNVIRCELLKRVVLFSIAISTQSVAVAAEGVDDNPDAAASTRRKRRGNSGTITPLSSLPNLPDEGPLFISAYSTHIDKAMIVRDAGAAPYRRPFDPHRADDIKLVNPSVLLALLADLNAGKNTYLTANEGVKVKWRLLALVLPFHVNIRPLPEEGDEVVMGGNGLVPDPSQDRRLWDYMCTVNDSLTSGSDDALSYRRLYVTAFRNNANRRIFCGVLMMTQILYGGVPAEHAESGAHGRGVRARVQDKDVETVFANVCAVFKQYDKAASILDAYSTIDELLLPYLVLDRATFQFAVSTAVDVWTDPSQSTSFDDQLYRSRTHPAFNKQFSDLNTEQKTFDDECRHLASSFVADIERSSTKEIEKDSFVADFGSFSAKVDDVDATLDLSDLTSYVREKFMVLRVARFKDVLRSAERQAEVQKAAAKRAAAELSDRAEEDNEEEEGDPSSKRQRLTKARIELEEAKEACVEELEGADAVRIFSCSFEDFSKRPDIQDLFGKVSLVLTDPPCNTRHEGGAMYGDHDGLSRSNIKKAAGIIEKLLSPHGRAFIFCSYEQSAEWRTALENAGGGSSLKLPLVPEVIVREKSSVNSGGRFLYTRANAYEHAWYAYKVKPGASQSDYGNCVAFGNPSLGMLSGSTHPPYSNVIDHYVPPRGVEVIRSGGRTVRPDQKSVTLLRDIIRLFAPKPSDIVVDLFAGTMSTVIAAQLEGHPVYACEKDPVCFKIGEARVHNFQYRRGAAGLIQMLSFHQTNLLKSAIPAKSNAPDSLPHEPETYETAVTEMEECGLD